MQQLEILEDIATGESQIDAGKGVPHNEAREMLLERISK